MLLCKKQVCYHMQTFLEMTGMTTTIAILGAGNIGTSLLHGLIAHGYSANDLWVADPSLEKLSSLQKKFRAHVTTNNRVACKAADVIMLAVKPQIIAPVAQELLPLIQERHPLIISVAAGISISQ